MIEPLSFTQHILGQWDIDIRLGFLASRISVRIKNEFYGKNNLIEDFSEPLQFRWHEHKNIAEINTLFILSIILLLLSMIIMCIINKDYSPNDSGAAQTRGGVGGMML